MITRMRALTFLSVLAFLAGPRGDANTQAAAQAQAETITLGLVAETHHKEIEAHFENFIRYVANKISTSQSEVQGKVILASTQSQLANRLRARRADFYALMQRI